jgi:hypothetical protein
MTDSEEIIFSPNFAIDRAIREMLSDFSIESQRRIRRAIQNAKKSAEAHRDENTDAGARHIFRELIPASILNQNGFAFEYEKPILGKTPDWLDESAHIILESYTYERGGSSKFTDRVASSVKGKYDKYKEIIENNSFRFIVAVYLDFLTGITLEDCRQDLHLYRSMFESNPKLSAILFFTETYFVEQTQYYGFLCISPDSFFSTICSWPFETIKIIQT